MDKLKLGLEILNTLNEHGYEAYIVGGAMRNYILKKPIEDIDLTTNATSRDVAKIFLNVTKEGEDYFSSRIHYKGCTFEITTFRKDISYLDHRHPQSILVKTLDEDLSRRDFTMNALAMNHNQEIIDKYHGIEDMKNNIIRMIGNPNERFNEDALRVLRALDFSSRFNFCLDDAIVRSFSIDYVSYLKEEYVLSMVKKIASNPYPIGLKYIVKYQVLRGFPFYQVVCEEAYYKNYTKHIFALFYCLHNFLPTNIKLSNKERKQAKDIAYFVKNNFSNVTLYYGNQDVLEDAVELYNIVKNKDILMEDLYKRKEALPIHSSKDIDLEWDEKNLKMKKSLIKTLEEKILNLEVKNRKEDLQKLLQVEE